MRFCFSTNTRKDLARSLALGSDSTKTLRAVSEIELLAQQYYTRFIANKKFPEMKYIWEISLFLARANFAADTLEYVRPAIERRLEEARLQQGDKRKLRKYAEMTHDLCNVGIRAVENGGWPLPRGGSKADKALRRLTSDLAIVWRKWTDSDLPTVDWRGSEVPSWREVRDLQRHPLWIVYSALGIWLDAEATKRIVEMCNGRASG